MNGNKIESSLSVLKNFIESEGFKGFDPYDTHNSNLRFLAKGKWVPIIAVQLQKRNPINIRKIIGVKKDYNPKAMGLFLSGYSLLYRDGRDESLKEKISGVFKWLSSNYTKGYSGYCWGYNFDWPNISNYIKAQTPSIVVTSFVAKGIFEYFKLSNDLKALEILKSICDFILSDLKISKNKNGICFSYTPLSQGCCHNANMLGAEVLAKVYSITNREDLLHYAVRAVDFTVAHQYDDGHWDYSIDLKNMTVRNQIDFHQGFVLESLYEFLKFTSINKKKYLNALKKGSGFYKEKQFFASGRSKWRIPKIWPVDIHNQAQGIITFSKLRCLNRDYLNFAEKIAHWTINNFQDEKGYFYYQKHKFYVNKIPYMRWSQAWMFLALISFLVFKKSREINDE